MLTVKRTANLSYLVSVFLLAVFGIGGACATTSEGSGAQETAVSGPKPPASCEQYLALLSEERRQPLLSQYGQGGSCWTGSKEQAAQCDETCTQGVNQIIRDSLNKNNG